MKKLYLDNTSENLTMQDRLKKSKFNLSKQKKVEKVEFMSIQTESITKQINKQDPKRPQTRKPNDLIKFHTLPIGYDKK